jgi:hypothetical protein
MFAVVTLAAALAAWWLWRGGDLRPDDAPAPTHASARDASPSRAADQGADPPQRERLEVGIAGAADPRAAELWTVRLTGLDASVPWTSRLTLIVERRRHIDVDVDERGVGTFAPPKMARNPAFQFLQVVADDPNYEIANGNTRTDDLQLRGEDEFAVRPIALLRGRVLRPPGHDGQVRVRAFPMTANGPAEAEVALAGADANGDYRLRVPPDVPLLVVADAVDTGQRVSTPFTGFAPDVARLTGARADLDQRTGDATIVPACVRTAGTFGLPRQVADLTLARAARLTGRVTYADGAGIADVRCVPHPVGGARWRGDLLWNGSRVFRTSWGLTDGNGDFSIWLAPGVPFVVTATASNPLLLAGEPRTTVSAPGHVQLVAPGDPITIEVVHDERPVSGHVSIDGMELPTDAGGRLVVTLDERTVEVKARAPQGASPTRTLDPATRPPTVRLALRSEALAEARITLRSARTALRAAFAWHPLDGGRPRTIHVQRARSDEPFVMKVPPGDYRLHVLADPDAPIARYLLRHEASCSVPPTGFSDTFDVALGGRLRLVAHDANDTPIAASFTLTDGAGTVHTPQTIGTSVTGDRRIAGPGQLLALADSQLVDVLPPGRYQLVVRAGQRGAGQRGAEQVGERRQTVTIEASHTARVIVRLP